MGATFSRTKNWSTGETLTASDLNGEFDNILNNLDPSGVDDQSSSIAAMKATADPYPGNVESQATDLAGELQRIRFLLKQITGETQWYIDPDSTLAALIDLLDGTSSPTLLTPTIASFVNANHDHTDADGGGVVTGVIKQKVFSVTSSNGALSVNMPYDDTIPQVDEGDQVLSRTITPISASNFLEIVVSGYVASAGALNKVQVALFQNGASDAVAAASTDTFTGGANSISPMALTYIFSPSDTSELTFTVRVGGAGGSIVHWLQDAAGVDLGNLLRGHITITEYSM